MVYQNCYQFVSSHMAEKGLPFGALFSMAALKYGMLCIGLFR